MGGQGWYFFFSLFILHLKWKFSTSKMPQYLDNHQIQSCWSIGHFLQKRLLNAVWFTVGLGGRQKGGQAERQRYRPWLCPISFPVCFSCAQLYQVLLEPLWFCNIPRCWMPCSSHPFAGTDMGVAPFSPGSLVQTDPTREVHFNSELTVN